MTKDYYARCPIKNLSPEGPSGLTSVEEMLVFSKLRAAMQRRRWKWEWLSIDLKNHVFNIDHHSITKEQTIRFYNEIFQGIGKEVLEHDDAAKAIIKDMVAVEDREKKDK